MRSKVTPPWFPPITSILRFFLLEAGRLPMSPLMFSWPQEEDAKPRSFLKNAQRAPADCMRRSVLWGSKKCGRPRGHDLGGNWRQRLQEAPERSAVALNTMSHTLPVVFQCQGHRHTQTLIRNGGCPAAKGRTGFEWVVFRWASEQFPTPGAAPPTSLQGALLVPTTDALLPIPPKTTAFSPGLSWPREAVL